MTLRNESTIMNIVKYWKHILPHVNEVTEYVSPEGILEAHTVSRSLSDAEAVFYLTVCNEELYEHYVRLWKDSKEERARTHMLLAAKRKLVKLNYAAIKKKLRI